MPEDCSGSFVLGCSVCIFKGIPFVNSIRHVADVGKSDRSRLIVNQKKVCLNVLSIVMNFHRLLPSEIVVLCVNKDCCE